MLADAHGDQRLHRLRAAVDRCADLAKLWRSLEDRRLDAGHELGFRFGGAEAGHVFQSRGAFAGEGDLGSRERCRPGDERGLGRVDRRTPFGHRHGFRVQLGLALGEPIVAALRLVTQPADLRPCGVSVGQSLSPALLGTTYVLRKLGANLLGGYLGCRSGCPDALGIGLGIAQDSLSASVELALAAGDLGVDCGRHVGLPTGDGLVGTSSRTSLLHGEHDPENAQAQCHQYGGCCERVHASSPGRRAADRRAGTKARTTDSPKANTARSQRNVTNSRGGHVTVPTPKGYPAAACRRSRTLAQCD